MQSEKGEKREKLESAKLCNVSGAYISNVLEDFFHGQRNNLRFLWGNEIFYSNLDFGYGFGVPGQTAACCCVWIFLPMFLFHDIWWRTFFCPPQFSPSIIISTFVLDFELPTATGTVSSFLWTFSLGLRVD